jgi:hypothetical protein
MNLKNINWESETDLAELNECENLIYSETDFNITFEYDGIKTFAVIDFLINLYETGEEETNSLDLDVLDVDITIKQLLDENDNPLMLGVRKEIELQNELGTDLKIQF